MKKYIYCLAMFLPFIGKAQVADSAKRVLHTQGAVNFRDLGGYKTTDGHKVKMDKVFRSAEINHLSDTDMELLAENHIHTIVDFRSNDEVFKAKDRRGMSLCVFKNDNSFCDLGSLMSWSGFR